MSYVCVLDKGHESNRECTGQYVELTDSVKKRDEIKWHSTKGFIGACRAVYTIEHLHLGKHSYICVKEKGHLHEHAGSDVYLNETVNVEKPVKKDEEQCWDSCPSRDYKCTLLKGHEGRHEHALSGTTITWPGEVKEADPECRHCGSDNDLQEITFSCIRKLVTRRALLEPEYKGIIIDDGILDTLDIYIHPTMRT